MSLIGSLEDLSLGDILQIISLSQKSGVLVLRMNEGEGRIFFRAGLVCGAVVEGGPRDLRAVVVEAGFVREADFDAAERVACEQVREIEDVLTDQGCISAERLDSLRREAVEAAVVAMFRWRVGEFSFDVRDNTEPEDPQLLLPVGINAQYLAMEGARCDDEAERESEAAVVPAPSLDDMAAHEMFGVEPEPVPAAEEKREVAVDGPVESELGAGELGASERVAEPEAAVFDASRPVIAIDADLPALEWTKAALSARWERVHIFQRSDLGLSRIRQYLARAVAPVVLLSPSTPGDRLSGIVDAVDYVRRLKRQAPSIRVIWLQEDGVPNVGGPAPADAIAIRPASHQLRLANSPSSSGELAQALCDQVASVGCGPGEIPGAGSDLPGDVLEGLKEATVRLREASSRGEVLPVVIDYAAQGFRRVAMLMIRDGVAVGMAQRRLALCGGPDDEGLRRLRLPVEESHWLSRVLEERRPVTAAPDGEGDLKLAAALGDRAPTSAYVAPIESSGQVVAVIYGDDLPGGGEPVETGALEVVLHHAGLALDRAVLERALAGNES